MRIKFPFGRKTLAAAGAIGAGLLFWRIRARRHEAEDRAFEEEIKGSAKEEAGASSSEA
ncbi:MAG TPA: hypothetical protein VEK76_12420 [Candidatus Binatia bacterium]|nr:hypothetical protein [Candidatus Binatia bacterium]